jgi:transcriptional regulator with XRE-family HTH domain
MVRNNIELDVKVKCVEQGITQLAVAEKVGTTGQYVNRIVKKKDGIMNKTFVEIMEALGYDIEITYIPKEK